jgi:hypothetical protein
MSSVSVADRRTAAIRRISEGRVRWRVSVQSWPEYETVRGCLLFEADGTAGHGPSRATAPMLAGRSHEDVVSMAHDFAEDHLRRLLNSLG